MAGAMNKLHHAFGRTIARLKPLLAWRPDIDTRDAITFGSLAMIGKGISEVSSAAAWTACGGLLFWLAVRR